MSARPAFWLFLLYVFALGFMQPALKVAGVSVQISDAVFAVVCVAVFVSLLAHSIQLRWDSYLIPAASLAIALTLSTLFSADPWQSLIKLIGKLYLASIPFITFLMVRNDEDLKLVLRVWIAAVSVVSLSGVLSAVLFYIAPDNPVLSYTLFHKGTLPPGDYPRVAATFVNANMLANYLNVGAVIVVAGLRTDVIGRGLAAILLTVVGLCALLTISPGVGGIFLAAALFAYSDLQMPRAVWLRPTLTLALACAAFTFFIASAVSYARQPDSLFSFDVASVHFEPSARFITWQAGLAAFVADPILGRGTGVDPFRISYIDPSGRTQTLADAHNTFINVAADSGLIGLISLLAIVIPLCRRSWRSDRLSRTLAVGLICGFFYQGLTGSFEDARHLWLLMGAMLAAVRIRDNAESQDRRNS